MRVWIDLANSPHVAVVAPIAARLESEGHEAVLTARDHAQTVELARRRWPDVLVVGGESPPGRAAKGAEIARRASRLRRFALDRRPDVAFSHGSYAQIAAAWSARLPAVTMMDYEHQPANHLSFRLSFRLAQRIIVPDAFPAAALRRYGARPQKVVRYHGFKEELYLGGFSPSVSVREQLGLEDDAIVAVFRPPPEGALYHRMANERFDEVVRLALEHDGVQIVLLPRTAAQRARYEALSPRIRVPRQAVDGASLLAAADLTVGAGGTMNRESAVLGTPTYSVFAGRLAAVDAELMRLGRLDDLRAPDTRPRFERKTSGVGASAANAEAILDVVLVAIECAAQ
jgi:predicted glycosyltransferase